MDLQVIKFKDFPCLNDCHVNYTWKTCFVCKHKIIFVAERHRTVAISFECLIFCKKLGDIHYVPQRRGGDILFLVRILLAMV